MATKRINRRLQYASFPIWHSIYWLVASLFMFFIFSNRNYDIQIRIALSILLIAVSYAIAWATNKFLIPNLLFKGKNLLFIYMLSALILLSLWFILLAIFYILLYSSNKLPSMIVPTQEDVIILITGTYIISLLSSVFHFIKESYHINEEKLSIEEQKNTIELKLKEAQLQLLKEQIHPHFIFNMMNNLYALVNENVTLSREVIVRLSDLLDYMLYECNTEWVPLSNEIKFINNYIELEKIRHDDNFNVKTDFPDNIADIMVAPLILFPFVENAFKHGLKQTSKDYINLKLEIKAGQIHFSIKNSKHKTVLSENLISKNKGIGLKNVQERLELTYPDSHELQINSEHSTFEINLNINV